MTFVALDNNGRPIAISPLLLETPEEQRRNREAQARREARLREKTKEKACQRSAESCD
jgi:acyl-CoA hydrolase